MRALRLLILAALLLSAPLRASAIILYRTGDPNENTTAPGGDLAGSGWQYQGIWGAWLGTPIAPNFFVAAKHVGNNGVFVLHGVHYQVVRGINDPASDLTLWQVAQPFPASALAPVYTGTSETGAHLVAFGRGTQRGAVVTHKGTERGWTWGVGDGAPRWGENQVAEVIPAGAGWDLLVSRFDAVGGLPNECHLSANDSSGAAFIDHGGTWKLAGIHYSVDGPFYTDSAGNGEFYGALHNMHGFYFWDGSQFVQITAPNPAPSAFYSTRISTKLAWIGSLIAEPRIAREGSAITLTYTRIIAASTELVYQVQQSTDLVEWNPATVSQTATPLGGSVESVKATVDTGGATALFLRLSITRL